MIRDPSINKSKKLPNNPSSKKMLTHDYIVIMSEHKESGFTARRDSGTQRFRQGIQDRKLALTKS